MKTDGQFVTGRSSARLQERVDRLFKNDNASVWSELLQNSRRARANAVDITIDDDILSAAKEMAAAEKKSFGEVISSLARRALSPKESRVQTRNGVPLLRVRKGTARVTSDLVRQLRESG